MLNEAQEELVIMILCNQPVVIHYGSRICYMNGKVLHCSKGTFRSLVSRGLVSPGRSIHQDNDKMFRGVRVTRRKRPS